MGLPTVSIALPLPLLCIPFIKPLGKHTSEAPSRPNVAINQHPLTFPLFLSQPSPSHHYCTFETQANSKQETAALLNVRNTYAHIPPSTASHR